MNAAAEIAATPPGPPWLAISLAILAGVVSVITALMPAIVERIKGAREKKDKQEADPLRDRTDKALDLLQAAMLDMQKQRDDAEREVARLRRQLEKERARHDR